MSEVENLKRIKKYIKIQVADIPTWEKPELAAARIDELQCLETLLDAMIENESIKHLEGKNIQGAN